MTRQSGARARASSTRRARWATWAAYAACAWAFLFAALSFFWAAGGRTGLHPLETATGGPVWVAINLVAGILKVAAGLLALALVRFWGRVFPHPMLLLAVWGLGVGMCLYGSLGLASDVLHVTGIIHDPTSQNWFFWYLVLWDPWWVAGGVLYVATAWFVHYRDSDNA